MTTPLFSLPLTPKLIEPDKSVEGLFKAALIFYDKTVIFSGKKYLDAICENICRVSSVKHETANKCLKSINESDNDNSTLFYLHDVIKFMSGYIVDEGKGLLSENISDAILKLLRPVRYEWGEYELISHPLIKLFVSLRFDLPYHGTREEIEGITEFYDHENTLPNVSVAREIEISLPPLEDLSYDDIFEFRCSPYIGVFRAFLTHHQVSYSPEEQIREEIENAVWKALGFNKPSRNGSIWSRATATAPIPGLPIPNPYGVYKEWKDGKKEKLLFQKYGWVWFIQEVREKYIAKIGESGHEIGGSGLEL